MVFKIIVVLASLLVARCFMCVKHQPLVYCDALNSEENNFEGSEPKPLLLEMDRAFRRLFAVAENLLSCQSAGIGFRIGVKRWYTDLSQREAEHFYVKHM